MLDAVVTVVGCVLISDACLSLIAAMYDIEMTLQLHSVV